MKRKTKAPERFLAAAQRAHDAISGKYDQRIKMLEKELKQAKIDEGNWKHARAAIKRWQHLHRWIVQRGRTSEQEIEKLMLANEGTSAEAVLYRHEVSFLLEIRDLIDNRKFDNDDLVKQPYDDCPGCD